MNKLLICTQAPEQETPAIEYDFLQVVRCPTCGNKAERKYCSSNSRPYYSCCDHPLIRTECPTCDYLMVVSALDGRVLETYL